MDQEELRRRIEQIVREELMRLREDRRQNTPESQPRTEPSRTYRERQIVTAADVEAASGKTLKVSANAIITPLARDRAAELGVELILEH